MSLRIDDIVPNFTADTSEGKIDFHDWIGDSYAILFSHPKDFTPVCTTEFGAVATRMPDFDARGTKAIGISVDGVEEHLKWKADIEAFSGAKVTFPIIADQDLAIAKLFDMLPADAYLPDGGSPADTATVRAVFIIGPDKKLRLSMTYPMSVGRNFDEIMRALDAIQLTDNAPFATPANWEKGDEVVVALSVSDEDAKAKYSDLDIKLPYLRMTSQT